MHIESGDGQDVEINLAPVIDCLTVIVAFLLASSSFLAIGIVDAGVAAGVPAPQVDKVPSVLVSIQLQADSGVVVKSEGKASQKTSIVAKDGQLDREALVKALADIKKAYPDVSGVTLAADDTVPYEKVMGAMESIRSQIPAVLLGGF